MISLHTLGHLVAMVVVAALIHKVLELIAQLEDVKSNCSGQSHHDSQTLKDCGKEPRDIMHRHDGDKWMNIQDNLLKTNYSHNIIESSIHCNKGDMHLCRIMNLCYHGEAGEFVMFQGERSIYENVDIVDGAFNLDLSSISSHNVYTTSVLNLPSHYSDQFNIRWIYNTTLIFKPFLPGNVMHVFHDDLIPLFHSFRLIDPSFRTAIQIFVLEDLIQSDTVELYNVFAFNKIMYKNDFDYLNVLTCFNEAYIGLSRTTVWYDFGFTQPQGPVEGFTASGRHIHSVVKFILNWLDSEPEMSGDTGTDYLVLLTRKENRKIINEDELMLEIVKQVGMRVMNINMETYSLTQIIVSVRNSRGIIGMHGSMLIFSIFLKPGSILIELFPYAVNPVNYTPYKTLANLHGMNIIYKSWQNKNVQNTVGHPDWPENVGGLGHLESQQREVIMKQTEVPTHLCCSDPSWLYHIYQDTIIDVSTVTYLVQTALSETTDILKNVEYIEKPHFYPSKIQNVVCTLSAEQDVSKTGNTQKYFLQLQWTAPWTEFLIRDQGMHYEVLIQDFHDEAKPTSSYRSMSTVLSINVGEYGLYYVWVKCVINDVHGGTYSEAVICEEH